MKKIFINHTNHPSERWSAEQIAAAEPSCVLCQGEFNYTFEAVSRLKSAGVKVVAATSERCVRAEVLPDGSTRQVSTFRFVQFREY